MARFGAATGTFLVPLALTSFITSATRHGGAAITFAGPLACIAGAAETRHRSLEETGAAGRPGFPGPARRPRRPGR